ncbi:mycothiol system anti-sigma-R factor [Nocardioides sp. SOB44]|jgi:mycothiol system anti-sigma-R factor|uniref:Mycothiol system anti-sigma-R factor n=1 Tax=Nocardioides cremeus TaxID=3058044 RepID=A0ABT8TT93_9ACTN|nr:mycothiol system anti-sigma-R factor [Nocardioides cremeus]MDO3397167.1 mycothiol system anti-sigma-R factor [Nocardioides cremeus]
MTSNETPSQEDRPHDEHHHDEVSAEECVDFLERIVYFLDNELDASDCDAVRLHLDSCNPCLAKYDLQRTVKQIVARSCSEAAPAELRERVMMRVRQVQVEITER